MKNKRWRTKFSRIHAQYPLKFIPTKGHAERLAVAYMISYGGGIVSGDRFNVNVEILENAILLLMTQGNTKVFRDRIQQRKWMTLLAQREHPSLPAKGLVPMVTAKTTSDKRPAILEDVSLQAIRSTISRHGLLISMPDPVTSFQDSSFTSRQQIYLEDASSQLVLLDWFTSGRLSRGESWAFKYYASRIDVHVNGRLRIKDHMVLEDDGSLNTGQDTPNSPDSPTPFVPSGSYAAKLRPYTCFATLVIVSRHDPAAPLYQSIQRMLQLAEADRLMPNNLQKRKDLLWSISPCLDHQRGLLIRIAGMTTEMVRDFVKQECLGQGLKSIVGEGMFSKILM
ncbi:urease accessory protein UreD [Hesseltinella vesiculosa]|uniref:Urease accessory protein UreD n=1 Tax=Hesseltinella vesiculosa TaxID=101127 RepID=A0A1X2GSY4_9FUNG|nr:urease accessory protein UreD [Hesseltinella vesiculosa]